MFANVLRCKSFPNIKSRHSNVDILIIRENTEGEYSNLGKYQTDWCLKIDYLIWTNEKFDINWKIESFKVSNKKNKEWNFVWKVSSLNPDTPFLFFQPLRKYLFLEWIILFKLPLNSFFKNKNVNYK